MYFKTDQGDVTLLEITKKLRKSNKKLFAKFFDKIKEEELSYK